MVRRYVYRKSDDRFVGPSGPYDVQPPPIPGPNDPEGNPTQVPDYVNYGVAEFADADVPDLKLHRFDPATGGKRLATPEELAADKAAALDAQLNTALATGDVLLAAIFDRLPSIIAAVQAGKWDDAAKAKEQAAVRAGAKARLVRHG